MTVYSYRSLRNLVSFKWMAMSLSKRRYQLNRQQMYISFIASFDQTKGADNYVLFRTDVQMNFGEHAWTSYYPRNVILKMLRAYKSQKILNACTYFVFILQIAIYNPPYDVSIIKNICQQIDKQFQILGGGTNT